MRSPACLFRQALGLLTLLAALGSLGVAAQGAEEAEPELTVHCSSANGQEFVACLNSTAGLVVQQVVLTLTGEAGLQPRKPHKQIKQGMGCGSGGTPSVPLFCGGDQLVCRLTATLLSSLVLLKRRRHISAA